MGWQERPYSKPGGAPSSFGSIQNILFGSLSLGEWFGIHVRIHASLLLLIAFRVLFSGGAGFMSALLTSAILFGVILLHEFGHCFAARAVGGDAREILLWPLGGLAFVDTPRRPWPSFFATAGGPLVNVVICLLTGAALWMLSGGQFQPPLNPLLPFGGVMRTQSLLFLGTSSIAYYLWWVYATSWMLLFFNLLPIFPLDGGQLLQAALWPRLGYIKSMSFACATGMVGAIIVGLWGLYHGRLWLLFLAFAGFMTCYRTRESLSAFDEPSYAGESRYNVSFSSPALKQKLKTKAKVLRRRPHDDRFTLRDLNPLERIARARRRKQFERLMRDD